MVIGGEGEEDEASKIAMTSVKVNLMPTQNLGVPALTLHPPHTLSPAAF